MQLCDAFDIPILFLCDTRGIMVGPEVEKTGLVRHRCRLFVTGCSHKAPFFTVTWPTGAFGGMGLEGAVKLGYRRDLEAIVDPDERKSRFEGLVARSYERGEAVNTALLFKLDDVIDPTEWREWVLAAPPPAPPPAPRTGKKRPTVDPW